MISLIGIVLSRNFLIGVVIGILAAVGYLYANGNRLEWRWGR